MVVFQNPFHLILVYLSVFFFLFGSAVEQPRICGVEAGIAGVDTDKGEMDTLIPEMAPCMIAFLDSNFCMSTEATRILRRAVSREEL